MYQRKHQNFKAKGLYLVPAESLKSTVIVLGSTEPANNTGSYTRVRKRIEDTEIAMHQGSRRTILISIPTMQVLSLLKLANSEEQEEGGWKT